MLNKNALSMNLTTIILSIVFMLIILFWYTDLHAAITDSGGNLANESKDFDHDNVINAMDRCCSADCHPKPNEWETLETRFQNPRQGCTKDQIPEPGICNADPGYKCKRVEPEEGTDNGTMPSAPTTPPTLNS